MPNGRRRFPVQIPALGADSARPADQFAVLANALCANRFRMPPGTEQALRLRLGGSGFQNIKKGLPETPVFDGNTQIGASHKLIDLFVHCTI